jgi:DNA-directed RNA polymerase specialized sigma subunit
MPVSILPEEVEAIEPFVNPDWSLEKEYHGAYDTWSKSKRTPTDNGSLIKAITPVIDKQLNRFGIEDRAALRPQAKLIALKSLSSYDPAKANLNTFLSMHLQRLNRVHNTQQNILKVPEKSNYERQRVIQVATELSDELGRPATTDEISDKAHMSPKKIQRLMQLGNSINAGAFEGQTDDEMSSNAPAVFTPVSLETQIDLVYPDLSSMDKLIMEHSLGLWGKKKITDGQTLARKLKVSPATISQRKKFIQQQMETSVGLLR